MPLEGCAFTCWIAAVLAAICYWAAFRLGEAEAMIPGFALAATAAGISIYVIIVKYWL